MFCYVRKLLNHPDVKLREEFEDISVEDEKWEIRYVLTISVEIQPKFPCNKKTFFFSFFFSPSMNPVP